MGDNRIGRCSGIVTMGVDPAGLTGFAVLRDAAPLTTGEWRVGDSGWTKSVGKAREAAVKLRTQVLEVLDNKLLRPQVVVCEDPTSRSNGISKAYGILASAVTEACELHGIPVIFIRPTVWKKHVLGKGNASKEDARRWAEAATSVRTDSDNINDAICLALYGLEVDHAKQGDAS